MRSFSQKMGLLSVLIACAACTAAKAQEDDKSYLPPKAFQGKAEPVTPKSGQQPHARYAYSQSRRMAAAQPQHKRVRTAYRHRYDRYAYYQPRYAFPRFFFGFFN
jgi:hypothetical protein